MDYDGETGTLQFPIAAITAENFSAQATLRGDFNIALQAIIEGVRQREQFGNRIVSSLDVASSESAQRELKWLVQYHDATTLKRYQCEVPTADTAALDANDRAHADIGDADVVDAFVTAFEAYALTPDGHAPVVDEITLVGRRL
jgi:hypothetical protein